MERKFVAWTRKKERAGGVDSEQFFCLFIGLSDRAKIARRGSLSQNYAPRASSEATRG